MTTAIAEKSEINIDPRFEERYREIVGDAYQEFIGCSLTPLRKAIRVNTLKTSVEHFKKNLKGWKLTQVPWCKEGFWIEHKTEERFDIGNIFEHALGYFYVQDPASMIPPVVLDPKPGDQVLDMTAAPGSKSTQIAQYMQNEGTLVLNDNSYDRLKALEINVRRMGIMNAVITGIQANHLSKLGKNNISFDKILLDAPCSGSGTIRKSYKTILQYSTNFVKTMSKAQKQLITTAFDLLRKGGTLVYSTCTLEPEEDEEIISFLLDAYPEASIEKIDLPLKRSQPILEWNGKTYRKEVKDVLRIYPQDNDTEGFFVAKIRKS